MNQKLRNSLKMRPDYATVLARIHELASIAPRRVTKVDSDGVPLLVQSVTYDYMRFQFRATLFNGSIETYVASYILPTMKPTDTLVDAPRMDYAFTIISEEAAAQFARRRLDEQRVL